MKGMSRMRRRIELFVLELSVSMKVVGLAMMVARVSSWEAHVHIGSYGWAHCPVALIFFSKGGLLAAFEDLQVLRIIFKLEINSGLGSSNPYCSTVKSFCCFLFMHE